MSKPAKPSKPLVPTSNYVSHYDPAKSHHRAWLRAVLDRLVALDPAALAEGCELRDLWKAAVETKAPAAHAPQAWSEQPATVIGLPPAVAVAPHRLGALAARLWPHAHPGGGERPLG